MFAVAPRAVSGKRNGTAWFEFKATALSPVTRVEWPEQAPVIVIEQGTARTMLLMGYALAITDDQMHEYNAAVDAFLASLPLDPPTPSPSPSPEAPVVSAPVAETPSPELATTAVSEGGDTNSGATVPETPPAPPAPPVAPEIPEAPKVVPKGKGK